MRTAPRLFHVCCLLISSLSHKAIIAYLSSVNLPESAATLRKEVNIGDGFDEATSKKYEGLLEKKWTSVVRLQKKVSENELHSL